MSDLQTLLFLTAVSQNRDTRQNSNLDHFKSALGFQIISMFYQDIIDAEFDEETITLRPELQELLENIQRYDGDFASALAALSPKNLQSITAVLSKQSYDYLQRIMESHSDKQIWELVLRLSEHEKNYGKIPTAAQLLLFIENFPKTRLGSVYPNHHPDIHILQRAHKSLEIMRGYGSLSEKALYFSDQFLQDLTDPAFLLSIALGGYLAYRSRLASAKFFKSNTRTITRHLGTHKITGLGQFTKFANLQVANRLRVTSKINLISTGVEAISTPLIYNGLSRITDPYNPNPILHDMASMGLGILIGNLIPIVKGLLSNHKASLVQREAAIILKDKNGKIQNHSAKHTYTYREFPVQYPTRSPIPLGIQYGIQIPAMTAGRLIIHTPLIHEGVNYEHALVQRLFPVTQ